MLSLPPKRAPGDISSRERLRMMEAVTIAPDGPRWAIQHGGSVLGHAASRAEALNIGRSLVDWLQSEGRVATVVEAASFAPVPRPRVRDH